MSTNNEYDLYATAYLLNTTYMNFKVSTTSPTPFYLTGVIIQVLIFNSTLTTAERSASFTIGDVSSLSAYSDTAMQSYNTIYGIRNFHSANQDFLNYQWDLTGNSLTVTSDNTFS